MRIEGFAAGQRGSRINACALYSVLLLLWANELQATGTTGRSRDSSILEATFAAWERREESLADVACGWEESRVLMAGSVYKPSAIKRFALREQFRDIDPSSGWPAEPLRVHASRYIRLKNAWMYYEDFTITPPEIADRADAVKYRIRNHKTAFDGDRNVMLLGEQAVVTAARNHSDATSMTWVALREFLRPLDRGFAVSPREQFTVTLIDEESGELHISNDVLRQKWVVDMSRGFVVTRSTRLRSRSDQPLYEYTADYEFSDEHGWLPTKWHFVLWGSAKSGAAAEPEYAIDAAVTRWELERRYSKADFQISIPVAAVVVDRVPVTGDRDTGDIAEADAATTRWRLPLVFVSALLLVICVAIALRMNNVMSR